MGSSICLLLSKVITFLEWWWPWWVVDCGRSRVRCKMIRFSCYGFGEIFMAMEMHSFV
ncbi:hypothetical protein I3843_08G050000 [Carya illinoinensis]|nr:hypothetical protein I3760_08G050500 [Carya illinoinensis]KAG7966411.1 hypothetical protein I3843_08G050000 [Carya illinoinensis]